MKEYRLPALKNQAGMTLIELTIVLLILIGLAGLLIPYVGSFTQKTHDSTNSSNLSSLNGAVSRYIGQTNKIPDNLESLTNSKDSVSTNTGGCAGSTAAKGDVFCGLLDPTMFTSGTYASGTNIVPLESLTKAGLTSIHFNDPASSNKTFNSAVDGVSGLTPSTPYTAGTSVPYVKVNALPAATIGVLAGKGITVSNTVEGHLALALGGHEDDYNTTCYDYIAMGVGDHSKLINNTISSAPVHFPEDASKGPVDYYNHYLAIFQVDKSNSSPCSSQSEKAKFLGVVMNVPHYDGSYLYGANQSLGYAYQNNSNR